MAITINGGTGVITGVSVGGLPDGIVDSGTLATNSVDSDELVSGAVDSAHFASGVGGKILQVVAGSSGALGTMSSTTSWTDTGHSASITPSATSSTIWVMVTTGGIYQSTANQGFSYYTTLYRNGSNIGSSTTGLTATYCISMSNYGNIFTRAMSMSKIDSPSSTSAVEYKIYQKTAQSACTFFFNDSGTTTITLMEIGA